MTSRRPACAASPLMAISSFTNRTCAEHFASKPRTETPNRDLGMFNAHVLGIKRDAKEASGNFGVLGLVGFRCVPVVT